MKQTTNAFKAKMNDNFRSYIPRMTINGVEIDGDIQTGLTINLGSCGSEAFSIGVMYIPFITSSITNCSTILQDKEIFLELGLKLDDGTTEYLPIGYFTVEKPRKDKFSTSFTAYGRLASKTGGLYDSKLSYPASIQQIADEIASEIGVPIVMNGLDASGTLGQAMVGFTYRETLQKLAVLLGGYCTEDSYGRIIISKYELKQNLVVDTSFCYEYPISNNMEYEVTGLEVILSEDTTDEDGNVLPGEKYTSGNPNLSVFCPEMTEALFSRCAANVVGLKYLPTSVRFLGDIRLEPWDSIIVTDEEDEPGINVPCMNIVHVWDGGVVTTISAPGTTETEENSFFSGPLTTLIQKTYAEVIAAKEAIVKRLKADEADILYAKITELDAIKAQIEKITASEITTEYLEANYAKLSSFSALEGTVNKLSVDALTADKADIRYANLGEFNAIKGRVGTLEADKITVTQLDARYAKIAELEAVNGRFGTISADKTVTEYLVANYAALTDFTALKGTVESLDANKITTDYLNAKYASLSALNAAVAEIGTLKSNKVDVNKANIDEAWIKDLLVKGKFLVSDINAATGSFSHYLTGVNIVGDNITAGTITTERLVIRDAESDTGILYELNNGAVNQSGLTPEELKRLTLNGKVITAESITADKINVTDLFAQDIMATGSITGASLHAALLETDIGHIGAFKIDNLGLRSETSGLAASYDWASPHSMSIDATRIHTDYFAAVFTQPIDTRLFSKCRFKAVLNNFTGVPPTAKLQCGVDSYVTNVTNVYVHLAVFCDGEAFDDPNFPTDWSEVTFLKPNSKKVEFGLKVRVAGKKVRGLQEFAVTNEPIYWIADGKVNGVTNEDFTMKLVSTTFQPKIELYTTPADVTIFPHEFRYGDFYVNSLGEAFGTTPAASDMSKLLATTEFVRNAMTWDYLQNKPGTFPAAAHTHDDRYFTETEINSKLSGYSATGHTHDDRYYTETEINSKLSSYSATGHTHDDRYYTESEIDTKLSGKQNNLGFTPIQQGGGTDQKNNKIYIGWTNSKLNVQVDVTNFGALALESWVSGNYSALGHKHAAGDITSGTLGIGRGGTGQTEASKTFSCGAVNTGNVILLEQDCYFFPYTNQGHVRAAVRVHDLAIAAHEIFSVLQMPSAYCPSKDCAVTVTVMGNGAANGIYIASTRLIRVKCQNALTATTTRDYYIDFHFTR